MEQSNTEPTWRDYTSQFRVLVVDENHLNMIKELIAFYRDFHKHHNTLDEVVEYNLNNLEKMCNSTIDYNTFKNL